jgi:hypothetical protein
MAIGRSQIVKQVEGQLRGARKKQTIKLKKIKSNSKRSKV